jgi:hypothetical protein
MQPDGTETLAIWREAGEWWKGESDRQITRYIDHKGIRREKVETVCHENKTASEVRVRVIRDEKVSLATGHFTPPNYGGAQKNIHTGILFHTQSAYSLGGTMIASEIPALAAEKGYRSVCLADRFSLSGAREFCRTAKEVGIHPILGITVELAEGGELVLIAQNPAGYRSLSRLVTDCCIPKASHA